MYQVKLGIVACACNPANNGSYKLIQPRTQVRTESRLSDGDV